MLSMNSVCFSYRETKGKKRVLSDISADFQTGKIYAIYGSSGVGKTTCLSLMGGLDTPKKGSITVDGKDIKEIGYGELRKKHIAFIFQDYHLFPYMTALENVILAVSITKNIEGKEIRQKAVELLRTLGIDEETMSRPITKISGGQQQRTAIARALIKNPSYILADEPTGNLDKENAEKIMEILSDLAHSQSKCIIIATHSDMVCSYADVVMRMCDGELIVEGK